MTQEKLHLVLAEDDQDDRLLFKNVFDKIKLQNTLTVCEDGIALMDYLLYTETLPHIIFLDLAMPLKGGMECLREIKRNPKLREITIAIYSSTSVPAIVEEAFMLGANVYIKKPDDFNELRRILSEVIYINWQYVTDGLDKESFIINY
jgi:CheY-like chemotaxis protein